MTNELEKKDQNNKGYSRFGMGLTPRGLYIRTKMNQQQPSKPIIAKHIAKEYVKDFDAVLLDAGSTAELIAEELFTQRQYLSVMTNNMGAYASYTRAVAPGGREYPDNHGPGFRKENELLLPGGRYDATYEALFGDATVKAIQVFTPNVTIIGVSGLRFNEGVFCHGSEEIRVKNLLWTIPTDIRVIAADWTKIGKRDAHAFGAKVNHLTINAQHAIVVTSSPPRDAASNVRKEFDEQVHMIEKANIKIDILKVPAIEDSPKPDNEENNFDKKNEPVATDDVPNGSQPS